MHSSQTTIWKTGWRIISTTTVFCNNTQLTYYGLQCKMKNRDGMDDQHHYFTHAIMHNSQSMAIKTGWKVEIGLLATSFDQHDLMCRLTGYSFQSDMKSGDGIISIIASPVCHYAQLTTYDHQSRM